MESDREGAEGSGGSPALRQLEVMVRALGEELAGFRRRAQAAEARVRLLEAEAAARRRDPETAVGRDAPERVRELEAQNADLRARLAWATARTRAIAARMKFVRQQGSRPIAPGQGGS